MSSVQHIEILVKKLTNGGDDTKQIKKKIRRGGIKNLT